MVLRSSPTPPVCRACIPAYGDSPQPCLQSLTETQNLLPPPNLSELCGFSHDPENQECWAGPGFIQQINP